MQKSKLGPEVKDALYWFSYMEDFQYPSYQTMRYAPKKDSACIGTSHVRFANISTSNFVLLAIRTHSQHTTCTAQGQTVHMFVYWSTWTAEICLPPALCSISEPEQPSFSRSTWLTLGNAAWPTADQHISCRAHKDYTTKY